MTSRKLMVTNASGLHVYPARNVANAAESCSSHVTILHDNHIINAKSLLNILSAGIRCGEQIELCCEGECEREDLEKMIHVIRGLTSEIPVMKKTGYKAGCQ